MRLSHENGHGGHQGGHKSDHHGHFQWLLTFVPSRTSNSSERPHLQASAWRYQLRVCPQLRNPRESSCRLDWKQESRHNLHVCDVCISQSHHDRNQHKMLYLYDCTGPVDFAQSQEKSESLWRSLDKPFDLCWFATTPAQVCNC